MGASEEINQGGYIAVFNTAKHSCLSTKYNMDNMVLSIRKKYIIWFYPYEKKNTKG